MTPPEKKGRAAQKRRTRAAIVLACAELMEGTEAVTMPAVARRAGVSEATAYRYFPDLISLLREADRGSWPDPVEALTPVEDSTDPVARVACACEVLMRGVLARQGATRAVIASALTDPEPGRVRPGYRFGLIDSALSPLEERSPPFDPEALIQLKRALAVVISAEALFTLIDLCRLTPEEAIASAVQTASTITRAATDDIAS